MNGNSSVALARNGQRSSDCALTITTGCKTKRRGFWESAPNRNLPSASAPCSCNPQWKSALGLYLFAERRNNRRGKRTRRHPRDRDFASAFLLFDDRMGRPFRCANILARCRSRVGGTSRRRGIAHSILGRVNPLTLGWADANQSRRSFRRRHRTALASGVPRWREQRRLAHRRHHYRRAGPALRQLHAKLSKSYSAWSVGDPPDRREN